MECSLCPLRSSSGRAISDGRIRFDYISLIIIISASTENDSADIEVPGPDSVQGLHEDRAVGAELLVNGKEHELPDVQS